MSLFAEQKILEVRLNTSKLGDASSALSSYVNSPTDGTVLVLLMPRLDQAAQRTKWFKALDAVAGVILLLPNDTWNLVWTSGESDSIDGQGFRGHGWVPAERTRPGR